MTPRSHRRNIRRKPAQTPKALRRVAPEQSLRVRRGPGELSQEEITLLTNALCKGATETELKFCLAVAKRYQLDPFKRQIHFVPRWDSQAEATDGKRGSRVWIPIVSIDGLQHIAARDHKDYGSVSAAEYGPTIEVSYQDRGKGPIKKLKVPQSARVCAWKKGSSQPTVGEVWWEEIYPDIDFAPLVRRMPRLMLAKCARAQAIRAGFPATGGLLIHEETYNREFTGFSPEGRLMFTPGEPDVELLEQTVAEQDAKQAAECCEQCGRNLKTAAYCKEPTCIHTAKQQAAEAETGAPPSVPATPPESSPASHPSLPALFYTYHPESKTYSIDGDQELKVKNRDLLKPLFSQVAHAIACDEKQLGRLIAEFEKRGVPFKELQPMRQPGE